MTDSNQSLRAGIYASHVFAFYVSLHVVIAGDEFPGSSKSFVLMPLGERG